MSWFTKTTEAPKPPRVYSDGEFDIEGQSVSAIKRDNKRDVTIIGYYLKEGKNLSGEWSLPVSPEKHAELLRRFRAKIGLLTSELTSKRS